MILSEVQQRQNSRGHIERGVTPVTDRSGATPDTGKSLHNLIYKDTQRSGQPLFCVGIRYEQDKPTAPEWQPEKKTPG